MGDASRSFAESSSGSDSMRDKLKGEDKRSRGKLEALKKQVAHAREPSDKEKQRRAPSAPPWNVWSGLCAGIVLFCCCGCQAFCGFFAFFGFEKLSDVFKTNPLYTLLDNDAAISKVLLREVRLMLLVPLMSLLAWFQITCDGGAPDWLYYAFIPLLVRGRVIEFQILKQIGKESAVFSIAFVMGILDLADFLTDGIFPLQVYKCEPMATQRLVESFLQSNFAIFAPMVSTLHVWGVVAMLLSAAILSQQLAAVSEPDTTKPWVIATRADVSGFGAVAAHYDQKDTGRGAGLTTLIICVVKVIIENISQLWMQISYLGLTYDLLSARARTKLVFSISLGMASALYKAVKMTVHAVREGSDGVIASALLSIAIIGLTLFLALKLYFTCNCESHIWNLSSWSCANSSSGPR